MSSIYGGSATFSGEGKPATPRSDGVSATGQPDHLTSGHDAHASSEIPDEHAEKTPSTSRRPLFGSMREALESEGRLKEEAGGYVVKRCIGHRQQQPQQKPRNGGAKGKQRRAKTHESNEEPRAAIAAAEQQADSAGYTVIRRRASIDEGKAAASPSSSLEPRRKTSPQMQPARRNPRSAGTTPNRNYNKDKKHERSHQQKQPKGWRHASPKPETSSGLGSMLPPASSSSPPSHTTPADLQLPLSTPLLPLAAQDPSGLLAASGWVVKATASAANAAKIEEPPVAALWPEHPTPQAGDADNGWTSTTATTSSGQSTTSWPPADSDQSVGASSSSATAEQSSGWLGWESPANKLLQL
ncbi:hypothetical protein BBJ28_00009590 [Nothophytophthora sp. Chile5]|nr:hypothetical protein BBJ28_00009590 [Nothophytophthora sp. Chile5]